MSRRDVDWAYLAQGMLPRLALCALALLALAASQWLRADYASRAEQERQQLDALEQQRVELGSRLQARQRFEQRFRELDAAGVVGDEQRLAWAQALRDSAGALRLPYLRFSASPRRPFEAPYLVPGEAAPVLATAMELQAGLVHEGDLLRLFSRLREQAPGLMAVTGCSLERVAGDAPPQPDRANLTSACQLHWYSIVLPGAAMAMEPGE